jgi:hypothetical protein
MMKIDVAVPFSVNYWRKSLQYLYYKNIYPIQIGVGMSGRLVRYK